MAMMERGPAARAAVQMMRADHANILAVGLNDEDGPWLELLEDVLYSLRRAGWTVTPPHIGSPTAQPDDDSQRQP